MPRLPIDEKKCEEFKKKYFARMRVPTNLTSERLIIVDNLAKLHELVEPDFIPRAQRRQPMWQLRPSIQARLGRFRDPSIDRKYITADMDIIRFYLQQGVEPPSFVEAGPRRRLFHNPRKVRIAILTSGGIAPGLNTVIESIVRRHMEYGLNLTTGGAILGFQDGLAGLEQRRFVSLTPDLVAGWCRSGGSKLGVARGSTNVARWLSVLERQEIDIVYVIGGNGSLTAAWKLAEAAKCQRLDLSVAVVPKTMDNDILWVWQSFGFVTAFHEAAEEIEVLHTDAESCRRVCVIQLFGAKSGHVAANAALAHGNVDAVLIPEDDFEVNKVCKLAVRQVKKNGHAIIVMAEGTRPVYQDDRGRWWRWQAHTRRQRLANFQRMQQTLQEALKKARVKDCEVFGNRPQHLIRAVPPNSHDQVYCRRLGDMVVDNCLAGYTNFMISFWLTEYVLVPLYFSAKGGLTDTGYKTFPTGGIFWRTVLQSTGQGTLLSVAAKKAIREGRVSDEEG